MIFQRANPGRTGTNFTTVSMGAESAEDDALKLSLTMNHSMGVSVNNVNSSITDSGLAHDSSAATGGIIPSNSLKMSAEANPSLGKSDSAFASYPGTGERLLQKESAASVVSKLGAPLSIRRKVRKIYTFLFQNSWMPSI